ncbi:MAG: uL22 family ribosomal protein [Candidatus Aenigmatarchaeota archaeon]
MVGYPVEIKEDDVKAAGVNLRISNKKARKVCKEINRNKMKLEEAKQFLEDLIDGKKDIGGKHYTSASEAVLEVLENAESNATDQEISPEKLRIKTISAEPGSTFRRRRRRNDFGTKLKTSHVKVVLHRG